MFVFQYVSQKIVKASSRHIEDVFARHLPRRLQDVFARRPLEDVFMMTSWNNVLKTFWRRLGRQKKVLHWRHLQDFFKTFSVRLHQDECLVGCDQFRLCSFMFSFVRSSYLIIFVLFYYIVTTNLFFYTD